MNKEDFLRQEDKVKIKKKIQELHDSYHPEAIFMTQTRATLFGWVIKEIYRTAWPDENVPKILTINPRPLRYNKSGKLLSAEDTFGNADYDKVGNDIAEKIKKYKVKGNIAVIDEYGGDRTLSAATSCVGAHSRGAEIKDIIPVDLDVDRPSNRHGPWKREPLYSINYSRADTPERRYSAKEMIKQYKLVGQEIGNEIKKQREGRRSLEKSLGIILIFAGLFLSMNGFSNFTGFSIFNGDSKVELGIAVIVMFIAGISFLLLSGRRK